MELLVHLTFVQNFPFNFQHDNQTKYFMEIRPTYVLLTGARLGSKFFLSFFMIIGLSFVLAPDLYVTKLSIRGFNPSWDCLSPPPFLQSL